MSMNVFISSEMETSEDKKRREAVAKEVKELGHKPMVFEDLPGRPFAANQDALDKCRELVRKSDILVAIVDDTVSTGMKVELKEALKSIGEKKIFYYFTKKGIKDEKARTLWDNAKRGYILKEFKEPSELRKEIKQSIASYLEDALKKKEKKSKILMKKTIELSQDEEWSKKFELKKDDVITITCLGDGKFYVGFYYRERYIQLRNKVLDKFGFKPGTHRKQYTEKVPIPADDDYYLVLRRSMWRGKSAKILITVKKESK